MLWACDNCHKNDHVADVVGYLLEHGAAVDAEDVSQFIQLAIMVMQTFNFVV